MLTQFLAQVTGSWLSIAGYGTMVVILAETLGHAWESGHVLRECGRLESAFVRHRQGDTPRKIAVGQELAAAQLPGPSLQRLQSASDRLLSDQVRRARYTMHHWELVSPSIGLGWTMMAFVAALPGALEALQSDPGALFAKVGMGGGTSVIGVACYVVALTQRLRLDMAAERLADLAQTRRTGS